MDFLSIITRVRNEPFLEEFVDYYLSQGVDRIYILDNDSEGGLPSSVCNNSRVEIYQSQHFHRDEMEDAKNLYERMRRKSEWFMLIDADEFITTKRASGRTLRDEIKTTFSGADLIKVPWVMMSSNGRKYDPKSLLLDTVYRWNHDLRHPHPYGWSKGRCRFEEIEVKSIFKGSKFPSLENPHLPKLPKRKYFKFLERRPRIVESINNNDAAYDPFFQNLREMDISNGFLLCYHYRVISEETCLRKITSTNLDDYKVNLEQLMVCDYPDLIDTTLKDKFSAIT